MLNYIKKTTILGLLFLLPITVALFLLVKLFGYMTLVAGLFTHLIPIHHIYGVAIANVVSILLILILCFFFGLFANRKNVKKVKEGIENRILSKIPGYQFVKAYTKRLDSGDNHDFDPVLVQYDDNSQLGFLVEEKQDGLSTVFIPGCPNPWSESLIYVEFKRIKKLSINTSQALQHIQQARKNADFVNEL